MNVFSIHYKIGQDMIKLKLVKYDITNEIKEKELRIKKFLMSILSNWIKIT